MTQMSVFARIMTTLRLRTQLVLVVALAGGIPLALSAVVAQRASADALTQAAMARVEAMRVGRVAQIEQAFATVSSQAATLAEDTMLVDGSVALVEAFHRIGDGATPAQLDTARASMSTFYERDFGQRLRERTNTTAAVDLATHLQQHPSGVLAQARFIADNPNPLGEKHKLDTAGNDAYAQVHARVHPLLRSYLERFGYYDIFVIDPVTNVVVYTVFKETDFGKRLDPAASQHDGLVRAFQAVLTAPEHTTHFEDFAPYEPSYNDAAAFVSAPVYKNGVLVAVLAMQLPVDRINAIVNEATGLGTSGHAFLVGADRRMRTQDSLTKERTIFVRQVDTSAVRAAANGESGVGRYVGPAGIPVLGAWSPVRIDGLQWSLVVELEEREALGAVTSLSRSLWQLLAASLLALAAIGALFSSRLARRIGGAVEAAEAVARGDFTAPIVVDGKDEVGVLFGALQQMRGALVKQMSAIEAQTASLQVLLDSTGDALLPVDRNGALQPGISTITKAWFGDVEPGVKVWDYLFGTHVNEAMAFEVAFAQMSDDVLPFELLADQMPSRLHRGERDFKIEFRRIGAEQLEAVLIIVRDVTALIHAQEREADFRQIHQAMQVLTRDRDGFRKGLSEIDRLLTDLERDWRDDLAHRRTLHTIKGSAAILGFTSVAEACHAIEDTLVDDPTRVSGTSFTSVRGVWRRMLAQLEAFLGDDDAIRIDPSDYEQLIRHLRARTDHEELLSLVRSFRDEPTRGPLNRLAAQATRVAGQLGKTVVVNVADHGLRLPMNVCDGLWLSAVHLVRNAVDHGLELPSQRRATGKPEAGTLTLSTEVVGEHVVITFVDDGAGVDWERVRTKARERGLSYDSHSALVDALFSDGLSTRDEVNAWSGRGVGMSAVKAAVQELGGDVDVKSTAGVGTTIALRVPLSSLFVVREHAA